MTISTDTEHIFDKIQHPFMIKTILRKLRIEGKFPQIDKDHLQKNL